MEENKTITVLLVDDEDRFRATTTATLTKRGFVVTDVPGALEAIDQVKKSHVDVVILDVKMPGMDGTEALHEIRLLKPHLPVIMLTGHGFPVWEHKPYMDGVFYLTKPCDVDSLTRMIRYVHQKAFPIAQPAKQRSPESE